MLKPVYIRTDISSTPVNELKIRPTGLLPCGSAFCASCPDKLRWICGSEYHGSQIKRQLPSREKLRNGSYFLIEIRLLCACVSGCAVTGDAPHIQDALRLGVVDYLIKPFRYERVEEALDKVVVRRKVIESGLEFTQSDIDEMIRARRPNPESRTAELEKGIQRQTPDHIRADLRKNAGTYRTAEQIAADTGLSKVTVRRYLNYLIGTSEAESQVDYSTGGRPRVEYRSR